MASSSFSVTTSGSRFEFGKQITVTITRDSQNYRHHVAFEARSESVAKVGVTNMTTWTPPLSGNVLSLSNYPNQSSVSIQVTVITYNGSGSADNPGTWIGSRSQSITVYAPDSAAPSISRYSLSDPTGYLGTYGAYVAGKSQLKATAAMYGRYGASIKQLNLSIGSTYVTKSVNITSAQPGDITLTNLNPSGTITATLTATDSRSKYTQTSGQITVAAYSNPSLSGTRAARWSGSSENDESSTVRVFVNGSTYNVNSKGLNDGSVTIKTAPYGSSSWTTRNTRSVSCGSFSYTFDIGGLDANSRWLVQVTVTDDFGTSTTSTMTVETASAVMDFRGNGTGVAFGKVAESDDLFDVGWPALFRNTVRTDRSVNAVFTSGISVWRGPLTDLSRDALYSLPPGTYLVANTAAHKPITGNYWGNLLVSYSAGNRIIALVAFDDASVWMTAGAAGAGGSLTWRRLDNNAVYPVGSVVIRYDHTSPASLYGGTWQRISGAFLYATGSTGTIGATGGSGTHTLTAAQMPRHQHLLATQTTAREASGYGLTQAAGFINRVKVTSSGGGWYESTSYVGDGGSHNNNPYYICLSVWRRTA